MIQIFSQNIYFYCLPGEDTISVLRFRAAPRKELFVITLLPLQNLADNLALFALLRYHSWKLHSELRDDLVNKLVLL